MDNITVIILFHNNNGINICLQAVLSQLEDGDEIILVNDHSEAAYLSEIDTFLKDPRIHMYSVCKKCGNRSYNRNLGAAKSKNDILLFLDGDMVLCSGSLKAFRRAHKSKGYVAFLGNAHGMRFSELHMSLYLGHRDYLNMLQTDKGRRQLLRDPALADWRRDPFANRQLEPYYWIYYYTCICSVTRAAFQQIGGFDESLITWGSEDIDLGYRLSLLGKIGYATDAHAFHVPHTRNLWDEQLFDRDNTRYLLDKHRSWPFELLLSFDLSGEIYQAIEELYNEISCWDVPSLSPEPAPDTIWVNLPSASHHDDSVIWYNDELKMTRTGLLGLSIPCCDKRFRTAYVSSNIFSYPMILTARILQECMRISSKTLIVPSGMAKRTLWDKAYLLQSSDIYRVYRVSIDTMEYSFEPLEDGLIQVLSPQIDHGFQNSRSHCPVHISAESRRVWSENQHGESVEWLVINFLPRNTQEICQKIENALGIHVCQSYQLSVEEGEYATILDSVPYALRQNKHPLFFVVPSAHQINTQSLTAWAQFRPETDYMLDTSGEIRAL